jgi:cytochrome c-type biogenesis protein CcmF
MAYLGEHLLPGIIGNISIWASICLAGVSFVFYIFFGFKDKIALKRIADYSFFGHFISVSLAVIILFIILLNHFYEYAYVWQYSSSSLSLTYLISSFWAGQEGSFLLWLLLQAVFGVLILFGKSPDKYKTLAVISLSQIFLLILLISLNPFELLRDTETNRSLDFFKDPAYLLSILDGNSLNPLLQNFWMAIHPPVLFIGYAITLIPFGLTLNLLVSKNKTLISYIRKWTIASVLFLGLGLFLGGVWAYEDLSFGGFWSWDPVENASLVPWLLLLASLHLLVVFRKHGIYMRAAMFAGLLPYIFVIYSSFLTRSGFLRDTSAHSFGGDGKAYMFLAFLTVFILLAFIIFIKNLRKLESKIIEEPSSKEFWLFIGSIVLIMSAFQIIFVTSIPVINQIFDTQFLILNEREDFFNLWQGGFAAIAMVIMAVTYFLKNLKTKRTEFIVKFLVPFIPSLILTVIFSLYYENIKVLDILLLFSILLLLFSSLDNILRNKLTGASLGATVSHLGFGIFLLAVLIAFGQKELLTKGQNNPYGMNTGTDNLLLVKGDIRPFGDKYISYSQKKMTNDEVTFRLDVLTKKDTSYFLEYTLEPSVKIVQGYGSSYRPYIKTWLFKDVFVFLSRADVEKDDFKDAGKYFLKLYDTISFPASKLIVDSLAFSTENGDSTVKASLRYVHIRDKSFSLLASRQFKQGNIINNDALLDAQGIKFSIISSDGSKTICINVFQRKMDYIVIKAQMFPLINLLWAGGIILFIGTIISLFKALKSKKSKNDKSFVTL